MNNNIIILSIIQYVMLFIVTFDFIKWHNIWLNPFGVIILPFTFVGLLILAAILSLGAGFIAQKLKIWYLFTFNNVLNRGLILYIFNLMLLYLSCFLIKGLYSKEFKAENLYFSVLTALFGTIAYFLIIKLKKS